MKRYITILSALLIIVSCQKKESKRKVEREVVEISSDYIKSKSFNFIVKDNKIEGEGKNVIEKMINESQFIVFGENHYSRQTSILTAALIPLLANASYSNFVLEVGPNTANKLKELSTPFSSTVKQLKSFNSKYKFKEFGEKADPIPFFAGVEDAVFLSKISKNKMKIRGIDQEYYFSVLFLIDELLNEAKEKENYQEIIKMKISAEEKIYKYLRKGQSRKIKNALVAVLKDADVLNFFTQFNEKDVKATKIINDLKLSWDIYIRWRQDSHVDRISYMRNNLYNIYKEANKAKMFVKLGSLHAAKNISNKAYDIGSLTEDLAIENNTISSSINK